MPLTIPRGNCRHNRAEMQLDHGENILIREIDKESIIGKKQLKTMKSGCSQIQPNGYIKDKKYAK